MDKISTIILGVSLMIIMLGMGLSIVVEDFKRIFYQPKAIFIGLFNQIIILPFIAFILAILFSVKTETAIGLMILAACPGGPTSNLISHLAKADTALSVTLTAFSSFITILTIPFIINDLECVQYGIQMTKATKYSTCTSGFTHRSASASKIG